VSQFQVVTPRSQGFRPMSSRDIHLRHHAKVRTLCGRWSSDWPVAWDAKLTAGDDRVCAVCSDLAAR